MRIPTDRSLRTWIRDLIKGNQLYRFYKTDEWRGLRADILEEHHNECQRCKARGKYSRATVVHHVMEVKARPDLALSRTYIDSQGMVCVQLEPLCFACHNAVHERFGGFASTKQPLTEERW